ncbi:MAG: GNAT family N-acetyltransferase [Chloroflexales bacterium]|nr:GNAT family N-acetyltransferase [Chloroflexales bacterium]
MSQDVELLRVKAERVWIRPWQRRDTLAQESWPSYTDPFHSLWNIPRPNNNDDDTFLWFTVNEGRRVWAIEDAQAHLIGRISLREVNQDLRRARLGISLGAPYVGQGLGTEALAVFLDYYFGPLDFLAMLLDVAAFNQRAVRCYHRLGFCDVTTDWRNAGNDPSLRLLDDPRYADLQPFFRRSRHGVFVQFLEMRLQRAEWFTQQ